MLTTLSISKEKPAEPALHFEALYQAGRAHIEQLSGKIWTDYNTHDPGITILELLCFAITDLGYRTSYKLEDLLATKTDPVAAMHRQFLSAMQILPVQPVTSNDYRKLLIDIPGVRNAWLTESPLRFFADCSKGTMSHQPQGGQQEKAVDIKGLYDVLLELDEVLPAETTEQDLLDTARQKLLANRNLCEDFVNIAKVGRQGFILCAEIELHPQANATLVHAQLLFEVQRYLTSPVRFRSLAEMFAKGLGSDRIFEGPLLEHGFIDDAELAQAELRTEVRLSDIINIIMDIDGIKAIKEIIANYDNQPLPKESKWVLPVDFQKQPFLNQDQTRIVYYKDVMPVIANKAAAAAKLQELLNEELAANEGVVAEDIPIPVGTFRNTQSYYSFQNHFPKTYGLSEAGLPEAVGKTRLAQARQLKGYLLFFDQQLANYFAQLANVRELFRYDAAIGQTYFSQVVNSFRGYDEIYSDLPTAATAIQQLAEDETRFLDRRSRFLDHLLARFAEEFNEYVWLVYNSFGDETEKENIGTRMEFLQEYPAISSGRFASYNYQDKKQLWDTENVSGLEKRVARLLGIRNYSRRNLSDLNYPVVAEKDEADNTFYRFQVTDAATGNILLVGGSRFSDQEQARNQLRDALPFALLSDRSGYSFPEEEGSFSFSIINTSGDVLARSNGGYVTEAAREAALQQLIGYLQKQFSAEGMYVVEHLLLRPQQEQEVFMPICKKDDCDGDCDDDPYSFRISVILPAMAPRFRNMEFRQFCEKVIRLETPAHILPKICWVSEGQLAEFEVLYKAWLNAKATDQVSLTKKLKDLVAKLANLKSIYPTANIDACEPGIDKDLFVLGKKSLGTLK